MRAKKGTLGLALIATLALTITATLGGAASADPVAQTAGLKKCLKKAKRIQDPVKRKKAKKKCRAKFGSPTTTGPTPAPLVRATLTWSGGDASDADLDLFVFDVNGNRAGNGSDAIPSSSLSPDVTGTAGTETFTDLDFNLKRGFSFGVCYTVGGSAHTPFTITYITADGATHTDSQNPGSSFHYDYPADGVPIPSGYCPA
jgi:hypothetical protein